MKRWLFTLFSLLLMALGLKAEWHSRRPRPLPEVADLARPEGVGLPPVGGSFVFDVSRLLPWFRRLRVEERAEQRADWAVYATVIRSGLPPAAVRRSTYDRIPMRLPSMEEVMTFEYGPGRRLVVDDHTVWLFHHDGDPQPEVTLARAADQARMEMGRVPERFVVFAFRLDSERGELRVERRADVAGSAMFSAERGYVERVVRTADELASFVGAIDDVTFAKMEDDAARLGGRRFARQRTPGATLEDVATLYNAHTILTGSTRDLEEQVRAAAAPVVDAFNAMVRAANAEGQYGDSGGYADARRRLLSVLGDEDAPGAANPWALRRSGAADRSAEVERLRGRVRQRADALQERRVRELRQDHSRFASEPGFSLDPQWDLPGLRRDLELVLTSPGTLRSEASVLARASDRRQAEDEGAPTSVTRALRVADADRPASLSSDDRRRIAAVVAALGASEANDDRGVVEFIRLIDAIRRRGDRSSEGLAELLGFIESRRRIQCARYDGPLQGTEVGMVLFYTDLMAKLWAAVDLDRSTPEEEVPGFLSSPTTNPALQDAYRDEVRRLNSTRIWFGTRPDRFSRPDAQTAYFAPIATRVYSAGSNNLNPGEESESSELSRQVFGWWDRHFARVADWEPMYHRQNQIMKWSVITGALRQRNLVPDLGARRGRTDLVFDEWARATPSLRYHGRGLTLLPRDRWINRTECMEIISSRQFGTRLVLEGSGIATTFHVIEGGVSLGSFQSLERVAPVNEAVESTLRRGGLDYAHSSADRLVNVRGVAFDVADAASEVGARVRSTLPTEGLQSRLRFGAADLSNVRGLDTLIEEGAGGSRLGLTARVGDRELSVGTFGQAAAERDALRWNAGAIESDRQVARLLAGRGEAGERGASLATLPEVRNDAGAFVLDRGGDLEVLHLGDAGARQPARVLHVVPQGEVGQTAYLQMTPRSRPLVAPEASTRRVVGEVLTDQAALERLHGAGWQRLRSVGGELEEPSIERVFSTRSPEGRPVQVDTGDPALGVIQGRVEGDSLALARPAEAERQAAFDALTARAELTPGRLREVVHEAAGAERVSLRAAEPAGREAAEMLRRDDPAALLGELERAAQEGRLRQTVDHIDRAAQRFDFGALSNGRPSRVAAWVRDARRAGTGADARMLAALHDIEAGRVGAAQRGITSALADGHLSADAIEQASAMSEAMGSPEVGAFVRARASAAPESLVGRLHVEASGDRLVVALDADRSALQARPLGSDETARLVSDAQRGRRANIYIVDDPFVARLDLDGAPGEALGRLRADAHYVWERIEPGDTGAFEPEVLQESGRRYRRRTWATGEDSALAEGLDFDLGERVPVVLVHRDDGCPDANGDGVIDPAERARCDAPAR